DHPDHATVLNTLGIALQTLFEHTGQTSVLEEAVAVGREAVAATPNDHPDHAGFLNTLGIALLRLFERTGQMRVLEEAVAMGREAVTATINDHPDAGLLNTLGNALGILFKRTGQTSALEAAVTMGREAVAATPNDHPNRATVLNTLGIALQTLFEHTGQTSVLEEAVAMGREAVAATPNDHPNRAGFLNNLGNALGILFERTGQTSALEAACSCYHEAAVSTTGGTRTRIAAYRRFAYLVSGPDAPQAGLTALEDALDLVEMLVPGHLVRTDREHQLGLLSGLAGEAAAAALAAGKPERAVELLERTRGILAADTLGMRSRDTIRLREYEPHLADELDQLRSRLDGLDHPGSASTRIPGAAENPEAVRDADRRLADDRREAHAAWQRLIARIRGIPGFEGFLQAPSISELARHAQEGPVVIVNTGSARCDALILTDTPDNPVQVIPLPDLTHANAVDQVRRMLAAQSATADHRLDPRERIKAQQEILTVLAWAWDSISEPVLDHLGHTATPRPGKPWPRVWWCPVGLLAFLPLHAAGHHKRDAGRPDDTRAVLDRVVSSYTTTVRALSRTRPRSATTPTLVVPVADTPGAPLPGVGDETTAIAALIPDARLLTTPTRETVLRALPGHRIAHFACHGHGDWTDPARSRLILTDHDTAPLTMADITALDLTADLAYLSACDTSVTAPRLADESLHITGAFYLAGYRHVIGTLWPINDRIAAEMAADFYAQITDNGTTPPQSDRSAHALHEATRRLRTDYLNTPTLWAAHTHTGT
ncbi:CHAT domain-containing protein, partial [Streptomyces mirabilis]